MKFFIATLFVFAISLINICIAQTPAIEWQKCLGGTGTEYAYSSQQTIDGGYIVAGTTPSNDGDVSGNHGGGDFWVVKMNSTGIIEWQKCLGGTSFEKANCIKQTIDGGYIITGETNSNDGNVIGFHNGGPDIWVVKLTTSGNIEWQNCLGGTNYEISSSIQQTSDGGYIISGQTDSNNGDVSGFHGTAGTLAFDFWIIKLSQNGSIEWQKCLGGTIIEKAQSIQQTLDGGYIVAGATNSNNGDVSGNHGLDDFWIVKLSGAGNIEWQKCLGGSSYESAVSISQTIDEGYVIAGATQSNNGDVSGNHGGWDFWIVKLNTLGNIEWQKCLGGSNSESPSSILQTPEGGYIIAGYTNSNNGNVTGNHGVSDFWVLKMNTLGSLQWQKCYGGSSNDVASSIYQIADGSYYISGYTSSNNGDISGNHGNSDFWVVKLASTQKIKAEKQWDKSFPTQAIAVKGVAADGVSRLYLKVSKANSNVTSTFQKVTVSLSNGANTTTNMLGKVKAATVTNAYSTEANTATSIADSTGTAQSGDFWFWYVAPDDFTDNINSALANDSVREVKAHIVARFTDGTKDSTDVIIKIVRPPLVMVHGLAGNEHSWDNFNYGSGVPFINSPLFKQKKAVKLLPHAPFFINANNLLSPDLTIYSNESNKLNTLQGNIEALRKQGYASNQVDYVCHSMGGCVLRTAINNYSSKFYGLDNLVYKNYGKGFVHKAIILSTPHKSSPVADAVTEFIPQVPAYINLLFRSIYTAYPYGDNIMFDFIEATDVNNLIAPWRATSAVMDLQVSGGIDLAAINVKYHLIAGDVNIYDSSTVSTLAELGKYDKYIELLDKLLKCMRNTSTGSRKVFLTGLLALEKSVRGLAFIEWYSTQKGFPNFLGDGDLIVPLSSQLAGLNAASTNVTVFSNAPLQIYYHHLNIKSRIDVGNRVKDLLNSSLTNPLFGDTIPETTTSIGNGLLSHQLNELITNNTESSFYDTAKIKITIPTANSPIPADSIRNIEIILKDTVNLAYIDISFQGKTYTSVSRNAVQTFSLKIDSSFLGNMYISATAVYDMLNGTDYHTDTITVSVVTNAILTAFTAKEESNYIRKGEPFYPKYTAAYTNYTAGIPVNSPDIIVTVLNTALVQYNTAQHAFYAIADTGSTSAIIEYKGFKDTISFILIPQLYSGCINYTTGNTTLKSIINWERGAIPSVCDSVVVMPGHNLLIDSSIQIRALYISPGATVTIMDSTINLQIGELDFGNSSITNNGTLIINKGKISINGNFQLATGSSFTMTGGELILDANSGFSTTSLQGGKNIFDVSNTVNSFSFTGGILQIIDPPFATNSQAIKCPYDFGDNTLLKFGNGISTTASNNINGFGGDLMPLKIGRLILDAAIKFNNRIFINLNPLIVKFSLEVKSGNLVQKEKIDVKQ